MQTIKNYTAALLALFNAIKVSANDDKYYSLYVQYGNREKSYDAMTDTNNNHSSTIQARQLPAGWLAITNLQYDERRALNRHATHNAAIRPDGKTADVIYSPVPYNISYELVVYCRGATMLFKLVEQICAKFTPYLQSGITINEGTVEMALNVALTDVALHTDDIDTFSDNIHSATFSFTVQGNLYSSPVNVELINNINISMALVED